MSWTGDGHLIPPKQPASMLVRNLTLWSWEDGSVGKTFVVQTWGPEVDPWQPEEDDTVAHAGSPSAGSED